MMRPELKVFANNHKIDKIDISMRLQGTSGIKPVRIEDDVWIWANVLIMPSRRVKKESMIAGCTLLATDFSSYSAIGGNSSQLIRGKK
jgi:acetyltransferase-like isoleucine patch superfamily enzyme